MAPTWNYDRLPSIHESTLDKDITDANEASRSTEAILRPLDAPIELRPLSYSGSHDDTQGGYSPYSDSYDHNNANQRDVADRASLKSFDTGHSAASGSSYNKVKQLAARIRRKPIPRYMRGSVRRHPAADLEPTRVGRGLWKDQLLSDRSLRGMAALMVLLALAMVILVAVYARVFTQRANRNTSSVGGETQSCKSVTRANTALLLLINVCATMVLGMSNTFQQYVTSLRVGDLKHVLSKVGDSRVGTNSPFNINHKREKRKRAWAAWALLVSTSLPVHFLANSLIGPSYTQELPSIIEFTPEQINLTSYGSWANRPQGTLLEAYMSFPCWSAFKTGTPHYPISTDILQEDNGEFGGGQESFGFIWTRLQVHYSDTNCTKYLKSATTADLVAIEKSWRIPKEYYSTRVYVEGDCQMGKSVYCSIHDPQPAKCRLNVRMSAAFILMGCLVVKATYMVAVVLLNRGKVKTQCLTFGDVIVASASNPELRVQGECMVNAGDSFRRLYSHTCHKHCFNTEESKTGDEIGHCQKCKQWNSHDKFAPDLPQPTITTKIKKSLLSNLGGTALTQMILLVFCSLTMVGASLFMAVMMAVSDRNAKNECAYQRKHYPTQVSAKCQMSDLDRFNHISGGFGGFNHSLPLASLPPGSLANEFISVSVSNGAQFIYSLLYLMLIYNITLISQEWDWGKLEYTRKRVRTTLVAGSAFNQDYLLQLPRKILFPIMVYSILTHWMLGEALQTQEAIWLEHSHGRNVEHSRYTITYAAYPLWIATILILVMTGVCGWAFTYRREGFMPTMYGSIRVIMAATTQLDDFPENGVQWGDLGHSGKFRHAGLSAEDVMKITPNDIYAGEVPDDDPGESSSIEEEKTS